MQNKYTRIIRAILVMTKIIALESDLAFWKGSSSEIMDGRSYNYNGN